MNCFHLSILPVCVHMSFSVGAAGTAPRCALHSDMKQIFHYFQRAKEMIFLKNGQQNLQQCQYRPTAQLGQLTGENGFEFFPHRKLLMGQSTRDLEKRRYKTLKIWGAYACKVGPSVYGWFSIKIQGHSSFFQSYGDLCYKVTRQWHEHGTEIKSECVPYFLWHHTASFLSPPFSLWKTFWSGTRTKSFLPDKKKKLKTWETSLWAGPGCFCQT